MTLKLAVVMDPINAINIKKDSSFAMLLAAQARNWQLYYLEQQDLYLQGDAAMGSARKLHVEDNPAGWFTLGDAQDRPLADMDVILMRKDPPFDMEYIYSTYILEKAAENGTLVVNRPDSLRDVNEKVFTSWFPQCCTPFLITSDPLRVKTFLAEQQEIVVKPLDGMGGESIFRITQGEPNTNVILETITRRGSRTIIAQRFIPQYTEGDKRILMIDGEPIPYALARIPAKGESRANLATGGTGKGVELSERDLWICDQVGPSLREKGLIFVGLDVIGDYLTEINVTSPTCIRELDSIFSLDIAGQFMDTLADKIRT